jgi:hypothetical protein
MMILHHKNYFFTVGSGQFAVTSGFDKEDIFNKRGSKALLLTLAFGEQKKPSEGLRIPLVAPLI